MTILRRINIKIIIYLNDMLLISNCLEEILMSRDSNLPSETSRVCHKLEKVCVDSSPGNRVFGPENQICPCRTFFQQNKKSKSSFRMSEFVNNPQSTNINSGVDKD